MTRLLTSGWENACQHPQLSAFIFAGAGVYAPTYPVGGINGNRFLEMAISGFGGGSGIEEQYSIIGSDELFVTLNWRPNWRNDWLGSQYDRIYFRNSIVNDPFYFEMSDAYNTITWNWSGTTQNKAYAFVTNQWYEIRIHIKAVTTPGPSIVQVWIDSVLQFDWSDDNSPTTISFDIFGLLGYSAAGAGAAYPQTGWDNVFVNDENGATDNSQCIGHYLIGLPVTGAGANTELTPSAGSNWDCVEEIPPSDAEYVSDTVAGHQDSYEFTNTPALIGGSPYSVYKFIIRGRHGLTVDAVGEGFKALVRLAGVDYVGDFKQGLAAKGQFEQIWDSDPTDSSAWDTAKVDAAEAGVEVV